MQQPSRFDLHQGHACMFGRINGLRNNLRARCLEASLREEISAGDTTMPRTIEVTLPTAKEVLQQAALKESERALEHKRREDIAKKEKKALIDQLSKPSGLTEEAKIKLAANVINRAVANGLTEVEVYRFPNVLCTDRGRAINQQEAGWEKTLTGRAQEIYQLWADLLQPLGYRIRYQVVDFSGGVPGDIGITISWG
jgi:hypothetical protein